MKICVLVKQVPDSDSLIAIGPDHRSIKEDGITFTTNESDAYALEEALLIKEAHGGEVIICSLGPESAAQVIKDGLAKGADKGIFLSDSQFDQCDPLGLSRVFKTVLEPENFDLILTGLQSDDDGNAQVGVLLAELLQIPHASLVVGTEIQDNEAIKVKRELEGGWYQWTELSLPACLTIQSGINKPRYASLRGIMMMKKKPIQTLTAADIDGDVSTSKVRMEQYYIPQKTKETQYLTGDPAEIITQLVEKLKNDIKAI